MRPANPAGSAGIRRFDAPARPGYSRPSSSLEPSMDRPPPQDSAPRRAAWCLPRRPRLFLATGIGIAAYLLLPAAMGVPTRLLAAFDLGAAAFIAALWVMMTGATP